MKVTRTKIIPAIPAQPERPETYELDVCDICRTTASRYKCEICGRDLCGRCRVWGHDFDGCEGLPSWCPVCLRLWVEKYETRRREIEEAYDSAYETMRAEWIAESITERTLNAAEQKGDN